MISVGIITKDGQVALEVKPSKTNLNEIGQVLFALEKAKEKLLKLNVTGSQLKDG